MGPTERYRNWVSKLVPLDGWPLQIKQPQWAAGGAAGGHTELLEFKLWLRRKKNRDEQHQQRYGSMRVSFPIKTGIGLGNGGVDSGGLVLCITRIQVGASIADREEEDEGEQEDRRQQHGFSFARHGIKHGKKWGSVANVVDAASLLLLSRAFCGPVATVAMACAAVIGIVQIFGSRILSFPSMQPLAQKTILGQKLPTRLEEFSAASLLLSIGMPLLKWQNPPLHKTLQHVGAAIPVALGYALTTGEVQKLPKGGFRQAEALWRLRHRWAARHLCSLMSEFQEPSALGWLLDIVDKVTVIPGTKGFQPSSSVFGGNSQDLFKGSIPLPIQFPSRGSSKKCKEVKDEIIVSVFPEPAHTDLAAETLAEGFNSSRRPDELASIPRLEDWAIVAVSASHGILMNLGVVHVGWRAFEQHASLFLRACWLVVVFVPIILLGPVVYFISTILPLVLGEHLRSFVWVLLRVCLERGGAAFIKWGQWSSTREDLFPQSLCECLGRLHDRAPQHSYKQTRKVILEQFNRPIEDIFDEFPTTPSASGSIAQVYRAKLKDRGDGTPLDVAVKVRHPSVAIRIYQDFQIMSVLADFAQRLPALQWLNLRQSVDQFSHTMTAQADLRVEAKNLLKFYKNFEGLHEKVIWPKLIPDLVSEGVIVESFERGAPLYEFLRNRSALNTQIAAVGVDTYLKMLLTDNFVHTDLHPGNILARMAGNENGESSERLQLVLLDFGLAEELPPQVRYHFISFIINIGAANGKRAAHHLLQFSWPHEQRCRRPDLLVSDMNELFKKECDLKIHPIDLNTVLKQVLQLCRKHEVTIDSSYASLVVAVCVLVGFARSLDPELSIMDAAIPCLFFYNLVGRIPGGIYG